MDITELENRYMELFWLRQRYQWENYVDDTGHDLSDIDGEIYSLLSPYNKAIDADTRRMHVFDSIIRRACVDYHPDIARLCNKLDDWDNYSEDIQHLFKDNPAEFRRLLGERMREDVLELMQLRQIHARNLGFNSYPDLVYRSEELSQEFVRSLLIDYIDRNLPVASEIAERYEITWNNWFKKLDSIGDKSGIPDSETLVSTILERLGFERLRSAITVVEKDQRIAGYAGVICVPDDVRLLISPINGLYQETTLYHELGHAVAHALNEEKGIFTTWTNVYDETMAVLFERIGAFIMLDDSQKLAAKELWKLEETRCATSALFEMDLWNHPEDAEDLYLKHYGTWDIDTQPAGVWASDSFRSIDPVYIHTYVIAAHAADRTVEYLANRFGNNLMEWGRWLIENYYAKGRRNSLQDKIAATGFRL